MHTGEDTQGLRKIVDFTRLISIFMLAIHFYICCYQAFAQWHWTASITDRIISNIAKTGLFNNWWKPKLAALLCLAISLVGVKGKKDEKINYKSITAYLLSGLLIYWTSILCFYLHADLTLIAIAYMVLTGIGYLLMLTGGTWLSRILKEKLNKDIFNSENETFPQEERKLENEYSINLPAKYNLRGKIRDSWINFINPFRGLLVAGTPGAGKSYFVIRHIIDQHIKKGFSMFIYDFKYDDLSKIAYNKLLQYNAQNTFRIGGAFNHTTNILTVSGADQRASITVNLNHHSLDQRFGISFTSSYSYTQSNMIALPAGAITLPPDAPPIYDSKGDLNFDGWGGGTNNTTARSAYPFFSLKQPYMAATNFLNSSFDINYQPIKGLKLSSNFGYNNSRANNQKYTLIASQDPLSNPTGSSQLGYNSNLNWIIQPQVNYNTYIGKGTISVLIGASLQETNTNGIYVSGDGFTSDDLIHSISDAGTQSTYQLASEYRYAALFSRVNYNWEDKYIISLSATRDGSSKFGAGKQFGNFGSVGASWIFTEEDWFKNNFSFLSFGKFRGSYGITGSDGVGDYQYLTQWTANNTWPYNGTATLSPILHSNPNFQWQSNKKLEGAIDLGFFKDRISLSIDYYRDVCGNQLISFPTPAFTGFTSVTANSPAIVENSGWEFTVNAKLIAKKDFKWSINFNGAINQNKLLAYPNINQSPYAGKLIIGKPLNIINLLKYSGVDPQTGLYTFEDKNHDGQINYAPGQANSDTFPYDLSPKFVGGMGMNFTYQNLQLSLFFVIKKQIGINALAKIGQAGQIGNEPVSILGQQWQRPGDIVNVGKFTTQAPLVIIFIQLFRTACIQTHRLYVYQIYLYPIIFPQILLKN